MKWVRVSVLYASVLAVGLGFADHAVAQSSGYYPTQTHAYEGSSGSYTDNQSGYDYARVLRVDPVIASGYGNRSTATSQQCYYRHADDVYAGNNDDYDRGRSYPEDDYYGRNDGSRNESYRNEGYANDGYRNAAGSQTGRTMATVLGGIAGAVLGSQIGDGSGRYVGTAVGSMVGGIAGRSVYESSQRNRQQERRGTVRVCDPSPMASAGGSYDGNERLAGYDVTYEYANRTYKTRTHYHPGDRIRVRVDVQPE